MSDLAHNLDFPKSIEPIPSNGWNYPLGLASCGHSLRYKVVWETSFCGLCFLSLGYQAELPGRIHVTKQLADNGNPQQTGQIQAHVKVSEGIRTPSKDQTLADFVRRRGGNEQRDSKESRLPFADSLWFICGKQPPLAKPLVLIIVGRRNDAQIMYEMGISLLNLVDRTAKAVDITTRYIRKYHG